MSTETPWPTPLPSPHDDGNSLSSAQRVWRAVRTDVVAFAVVAGAGVVAAFPVGALWRSTAPAVLAVVNQGGVYLAAPETKTFIARDGWFALYACIAAVLLALFTFLLYRRKGGTGAALGLAVGGIAGGYLASWFGSVIGPGRGSITRAAEAAASGTNFAMPLSVRALGVIWLWPAVAAGLFFFVMLLFGPSEPEPDRQPFASWGEYQAQAQGQADADSSHASQNGFGGAPDEFTAPASGDVSDGRQDPPQVPPPA